MTDDIKDALRDAALHIPLGLALGGIALPAFLYLPPVSATLATGAWAIFFRELTQLQMDDYHGDITKGLDFWNWKLGKSLETWVPVGALSIGSAAAWWL